MAFSKEDLNTIRNKVDLLTFLENKGNTFRQTGASWVGLCPVHSERSPSFHVNPGTNTFRCFGCGVHGDVFSLVQETENLTFPGAVQYLAEMTGVKLQIDEDPGYKHRQQLLTITRLAAEWYRHHYKNLPEDHPAKLELKKRNLHDYALFDESVGFAPNGGLLQALKSKGFTNENDLIESGVFIQTKEGHLRERFRNRLTWTIYTQSGNPIAFSARKIFDNDQGPKYINSPATELYNKSKTLLGISFARRAITQNQQVYIVEGQTDVMALRAAGKEGTVASCGTAFGTEHANLLLHLSKMGKHAEQFKMVFCFDGDAAGIKAAKKVFADNPHILLNAYAVKFLDNNQPTDPCDYRIAHGDTQLANFIDTTQVPLIEFVLSEMRYEWNLDSPEGKSQYVTEAMKLLTQVTDKIQHAAYTRKVAAWTGLSYTELSAENRKPTRQAPQHTEQQLTSTMEPEIVDTMPSHMVAILAALVQHPTEALQYWENNNMDTTFFPGYETMTEEILNTAKTNEFDYQNKNVILLSHHDLGISDSTRINNIIETVYKQFLRYEYSTASAKLDSYLMEPGIDPVEAFNKIMVEEQELKKRYNQ